MVLRFFLFAVMFLFVSCTELKFENPDDPDSPNYRGATQLPSSSSSVPLSSSSSLVSQSSSSAEVSSSSISAVVSSSSVTVVGSSSSVAPSSSSSVHTSSSSLGCTESNKNLVKNGNFTNKDYWFFLDSYGSFNVSNNKATINVTKIGSDVWEPNLLQSGDIVLVEGVDYRIAFEASATTNRKIGVSIHKTTPDWDTYFEKEIDLTSTMQSFTYDFKMIAPSNENAAMMFTFGQATGTVTLSKVTLYSLEGTSCL